MAKHRVERVQFLVDELLLRHIFFAPWRVKTMIRRLFFSARVRVHVSVSHNCMGISKAQFRLRISMLLRTSQRASVCMFAPAYTSLH